MKLLNIILIFFCCTEHLVAQSRVGDPGIQFDESKFDDVNYPQMRKWVTAGVRTGIPFIEDLEIKSTLFGGGNSASINAAISTVANQGGGAILLKNGTYTINATVSMRANVSLIGESREGVKCIIEMTNASGFYFGNGDKNCGIYRLTIEGSWGKPQYDWNMSIPQNDELPNNDNISVKFSGSEDCWLDQVSILNSARDPMRCNAKHTTFRDLIVDGAHRKAGGAQGYFFIQDGFNLITGCQITHLRHISLQGDGVEYNVVYDNDFKQEVSFHSGDDGNNLIENNRITLPAGMPPGTSSPKPDYYAIMGAWSIQHTNSADTNYIYKNQCIEYNHEGNPTPWSNPQLVYVGPREVKPADPSTNFPALPIHKSPQGGTLYPVMIEEEIEPIVYTLIPAKLEAENYSTQAGIQVEKTTDIGGGENIGFIEHDDHISFNIEVAEDDTYQCIIRAASNTNGGNIQVKIDGVTIGEIQIEKTGGWQKWNNFTTNLSLSKGEHQMQLVFQGEAGYLYNINWVEINTIEDVIAGEIEFLNNEEHPYVFENYIQLYSSEHWVMMSSSGKVLKEGMLSIIETSDLPSGVYLIHQGGKIYRVLLF